MKIRVDFGVYKNKKNSWMIFNYLSKTLFYLVIHILSYYENILLLLCFVQFHINSSYPRIWNMPQTWQCEVEVYKATYHFIFAQKSFFTGNSVLCNIYIFASF